jgi:hypothetical protein
MQAIAIQGAAAAGLGTLAVIGAWARLRLRNTTDSHPIARNRQGRVSVVTRAELADCPRWERAFASHRKDARYYEVVERTIDQGFEYLYFVIEDAAGRVRAVQPFFLVNQDLLQGSGPALRKAIGLLRRAFPRLLTIRTLMVGCAAGEGHLDDVPAHEQAWVATRLHDEVHRHAKACRAGLVVLKEFHADYRRPLEAFSTNSFARLPSLPMTRLNIDYPSFEAYMERALSKATRKNLRRKFRTAEAAGAPIELQVIEDVTRHIDEVYPLYLNVYQRSTLHFEKLTKRYLCDLGRRMPDKVRFFIWRQNGRAIAFSVCMLAGDSIYDEYLGLDYTVALDLHLYFYTFRDIVSWAMAGGFKWYLSSAQNYDPKLHFRCELVPLDLYVAHTNPVLNAVLRRVIPWIEPTRGDETLKKFPNYADLWGRDE